MKELDKYTINKHDKNSATFYGDDFMFVYNIADSMVKEEFKGQYEYLGGLQCNYEKDTPEYKELESKLEDLARLVLGVSLKIQTNDKSI